MTTAARPANPVKAGVSPRERLPDCAPAGPSLEGQSQLRTQDALFIAPWAALIAVLSLLSATRVLPFLNSDQRHALAFIDDLLFSGTTTTPVRWFLPGANSAFPDLLIVATGYLLGFRDDTNFLFYSAVFHAGLFLAWTYFFVSARVSTANAALISGTAILLVSFADKTRDIISVLLAAPNMHGGTLLVAPLVFGLVLRNVFDGARADREGVLFLLTAGIVFSDVISVVQIIAPVLLASALLAFLEKERRPQAARLFLILAAGIAAGRLLWSQADASGHFVLGTTGIVFSPEAILNSFITFFKSLPVIAGTLVGPWRCTAAVLGIAAGVHLARQAMTAAPQPAAMACVLLLAGTLCSIPAPLLTGLFVDPANIRYQLPAVLFPSLLLAWWVAGRFRLTGRGLVPAFALWAGVMTGADLAAGGGQSAVARLRDGGYVRTEREAAAALVKEGVLWVLAEYWEATPLRAAGKRQFEVCNLTGHGYFYPWVTNAGWCEAGFHAWKQTKGLLAVDLMRMDRSKILEIYGPPDRELPAAGRIFLIYGWTETRDRIVRTVICAPTPFPRPPFC